MNPISMMEFAQEELVERMARIAPVDGVIEPIPGLYLTRCSEPSDLIHGVYKPSICVIAQGKKEVILNEECYSYDPAHYLINTVELPVMAQVVEASRTHPYLGIRLVLDPALVSSVLVEAAQPTLPGAFSVRAINASPLSPDLLDAVVRLVRLVDTPQHTRVLGPSIMREIIYWLLVGEQGNRLRHIAVLDGNTHHIAKAIDRLRVDFDQPLRMDEIAQEVGMSLSVFHQRFKEVTAMSPLQFQKRLRLQEAQRLMLGESMDAASAGSRVGYSDASHFNRDYKRQFGLPPLRDIERMRDVVREGNSSKTTL